MPMQAREIEDLLRETFPNAKITVEGNDGVLVGLPVHLKPKEPFMRFISAISSGCSGLRSKRTWMSAVMWSDDTVIMSFLTGRAFAAWWDVKK